jgi:hypothetical protein
VRAAQRKAFPVPQLLTPGNSQYGTSRPHGPKCSLPVWVAHRASRIELRLPGVIVLLIFSTLHPPQPIFYYVILRLPMFLGLMLALWIAQYKVRFKNGVRNLSSKLA